MTGTRKSVDIQCQTLLCSEPYCNLDSCSVFVLFFVLIVLFFVLIALFFVLIVLFCVLNCVVLCI